MPMRLIGRKPLLDEGLNNSPIWEINLAALKPIIIALDVESREEASHLVDQIGDDADFYKVGMELYAAAGMPFVTGLLERGKRVFLDLKLYDISETVKRGHPANCEIGSDVSDRPRQ